MANVSRAPDLRSRFRHRHYPFVALTDAKTVRKPECSSNFPFQLGLCYSEAVSEIIFEIQGDRA